MQQLRTNQPSGITDYEDLAVLAGRVRRGERRALAKALSLLESTRVSDKPRQHTLLSMLAIPSAPTMRIGITGAAGAGKSTLIEALGLHVASNGHRVAVLATDPAAPSSGGSILGDKLRMTALANHPNAFIRPSSNRGRGDALDSHVRERIITCEAAGYDVVVVETVGAGQADTAIADAVDLVILATLPNAGDDIQALKRGVMEYADIVVVTKADLDRAAARRAVQQIRSGRALLRNRDVDWHVRVLATSSATGEGITELWLLCQEFFAEGRRPMIEARRRQQRMRWFDESLHSELIALLRQRASAHLDRIADAVAEGAILPPVAAATIVNHLETQ
ncbi:MAG: ATPase/protein kinase [Candidatus Kapaibacterium sp.]|nr:MAG: ATPase/protein kinase [Candidatus Kapabacteria bacterium]